MNHTRRHSAQIQPNATKLIRQYFTVIVDNDPNIVQKQPSVKDSHLISTQQISLLTIKYKTE